MSFSTGKQSQSASRPILAPILIFIFVAWQAAYQFYLHQMVGHEDGDLESDGSCSVLPGTSGYSTLCKEAHLFKGWDEMPGDSSEELESLLAVSPSRPKQEEASTTSPSLDTASRARGLRGSAAVGTDNLPKQSAFMAKTSESKPKKMFSASGLTALQKEVDAKMQLQARRHAEHRAMRALSVAARGDSAEAPTTTIEKRQLTPWAQGLLHDMHEIEEHMNHWREERSDHAAAFAAAFGAFAASEKQKHAEQPKEDLMTPWAHNLDDLTHDIQHHMEQRDKERAEHEASRKAAHDSRIAAAHANAVKAAADMTSPLLQEIETLGAQLCQDPKRRNTHGCAHFLHPDAKTVSQPHAHHNHSKVDVDAHKYLLEKHMEQLHKDQEHDDEEIRHQSDMFLRELCADPARKSYPTCAHLTETTTIAPARSGNLRAAAKSAPTVSAPSPPAPVEYPAALRWTPLADSDVNLKHHHVGEAAMTMGRKQLRGHHWEGKIPKVACISVLPEGKVTENLMKYFIDNYYLQNYEGSRELVFVYHSSDAEAARIAHIYADGSSIKAAAARGVDVYPSATAYRYGAWIAKDADIVTRWDFEGFHHPNRLSMQVHAMALSKRPVSLLSAVTAFDTDGKHAVVSNTGPYHGSMMGDAAWMHRNWMPVLEEESAVLQGLHSGEVTQVAMPELLSYHDSSMFLRKHDL